MFKRGLLEETQSVLERFGPGCASLRSLGYAQAEAVLRGQMEFPAAIAEARQGHRNYAKRQLTWFRKQLRSLPQPASVHWWGSFGDDPTLQALAGTAVRNFVAEAAE